MKYSEQKKREKEEQSLRQGCRFSQGRSIRVELAEQSPCKQVRRITLTPLSNDDVVHEIEHCTLDH